MKQKVKTFLPATICILASILLLFIFSPAISSFAATDYQRVYDYADELSDTEEADLEERAEDYYQKTGYHLLVVITNTRAEYSYTATASLEADCEQYSEAFYQDFVNTYGSSARDCAIFTLDTSSNRYADVSGQGKVKERLDDHRCTLVFEKMYDALHANNWYAACDTYYKTVSRYMKITPGINPNSIFLNIYFQLLLSFVIGGIIIFLFVHNSGGKMTVNSHTYLAPNQSKVINGHDHYIRTAEHRTKRSSSSSSGGGSSHRSGGSHGGGHF